jgi:hypothetical protein
MFSLKKEQSNEPATLPKLEIPKETPENPITVDNDLSMILESLEVEEEALLQEKADLITLEAKLTIKLKAQIKERETKIAGLKNELPQIKQRCETLANMLGIKIDT